MRFWDSSALVPLLVTEATSDLRRTQYDTDPWAVVWFGTLVEIGSSLVRRQRDGQLPADVEHAARKRLTEITKQWTEVIPTEEVRARAIRLLRVHRSAPTTPSNLPPPSSSAANSRNTSRSSPPTSASETPHRSKAFP